MYLLFVKTHADASKTEKIARTAPPRPPPITELYSKIDSEITSVETCIATAPPPLSSALLTSDIVVDDIAKTTRLLTKLQRSESIVVDKRETAPPSPHDRLSLNAQSV